MGGSWLPDSLSGLCHVQYAFPCTVQEARISMCFLEPHLRLTSFPTDMGENTAAHAGVSLPTNRPCRTQKQNSPPAHSKVASVLCPRVLRKSSGVPNSVTILNIVCVIRK